MKNSGALLILCLNLVLLIIAKETNAQNIIPDTLKLDAYFSDFISLRDYSLVYLDSSESKNIKAIRRCDSLFKKRNDNGRLAIDWNYENGHWLKFCIKNTSKAKDFRALLYLGSQSTNKLYVFQEGFVDSLKTGNTINIGHRPFYSFLYFPIHISANQIQTFYLHIESRWKSVKSYNYSIQSYQYAFNHIDNKTQERFKYNFSNGWFFGIIVFIILYSFFKFILEKDKVYLAYILYLLSILAYYLVKRSPKIVTFLSPYTEETLMYNTSLSYFVYGSYILFILVFLNITKKTYPVLFYFLVTFIGLSVLSIILDLAFRFSRSDYLFVDMHFYIRSILIPIGVIILILLFKTMWNKKVALFILSGTLLIVAFGWASEFIRDIERNIAHNIYDPRADKFYVFLWPSMANSQIGVLLDVLCFSMGLSYRSKKKMQKTEQELISADRLALETKKNLIEVERDAAVLKLEKALAQQRMTSSELKALKAQIKPHFIGNALNSIKLLIQQGEKKKATQYLSKFATLMRQILEHSREQLIYLEQELHFCKLYLEIESLRFENQFQYFIHIENDTSVVDFRIPPLIIQPYLENAIWHGLLTKRGKRILNLSIEKNSAGIKCIIEDNGIGREKAALIKSTHSHLAQSYGTAITDERLSLSNELFETQYEVEIIDLVDDSGIPLGTRIELLIPI